MDIQSSSGRYVHVIECSFLRLPIKAGSLGFCVLLGSWWNSLAIGVKKGKVEADGQEISVLEATGEYINPGKHIKGG